MRCLNAQLEALVSGSSGVLGFEHRFLVREVLEGLLDESHLSAERAALSAGRPFVVFEPGGGARPFEVEVARQSTAPLFIEGTLSIQASLRALTGGGRVAVLPGPAAVDEKRVYELRLEAPWNRHQVLSQPTRAVLVLLPGDEPRFELAPSPPDEACMMFGVPIEVLEFTPEDSRWRPKGWLPLDARAPRLLATLEDDDAWGRRLCESAEAMLRQVERSRDLRVMTLAEALISTSEALAVLGRDLGPVATAVERAWRSLARCAERYPEGRVVDSGCSPGVLADLPARERAALLRVFPTPLGESLMRLGATAERLVDLLEGAKWREDATAVGRAVPGCRLPVRSSGPMAEDYLVVARFEGIAGVASVHGLTLEPSESAEHLLLICFPDSDARRRITELELVTGHEGQEAVHRLEVDATAVPTWHNHIFGVKPTYGTNARLRMSARCGVTAQPRRLIGLLLRRVAVEAAPSALEEENGAGR